MLLLVSFHNYLFVYLFYCSDTCFISTASSVQLIFIIYVTEVPIWTSPLTVYTEWSQILTGVWISCSFHYFLKEIFTQGTHFLYLLIFEHFYHLQSDCNLPDWNDRILKLILWDTMKYAQRWQNKWWIKCGQINTILHVHLWSMLDIDKICNSLKQKLPKS